MSDGNLTLAVYAKEGGYALKLRYDNGGVVVTIVSHDGETFRDVATMTVEAYRCRRVADFFLGKVMEKPAMNLLERMAEALRHEHEGNKDALASLMEGGIYDGVDDDAKRQMDEVDALLAEYERVRARTVVLTFEKAVPIATGAFAILDVRQGEPSLDVFCAGGVDPEEGEYAYCQLPHLPGPEVFE